MSGHSLQGCVRTQRACVLWTGGKDSSLALYEARLAGYLISDLMTFVPENPKFLAHPLPIMRVQAASMGLLHQTIMVHEPFEKSYEEGIRRLKERDGIDLLITGDIAEVGGYPNWIRRCSASCGVEVLTPLWGWDRLALLRRLLALKFKVIFSCIKKPWLSEEWLGRELDDEALRGLRQIASETGMDLCGEEGEYHTWIVDGPLFRRSLHIEVSKRVVDSLMYLVLQKVSLKNA